MQNPKQVLSCDWGTSSFRLRLIDVASRNCLAEVVSDNGNAALFNKWKTQPSADRMEFYLSYLKTSIDSISASIGSSLDDLCVLISGMASSSVGMKELPYADLPFALDGHSAYAEWINAGAVLPNPVLLLSGVQQPGDVMRGEETQLAGVAKLMDLPADNEMLYLFPGTHCKHITVSNNRIVHFATYMTGEIFDLLVKHSILGHAVSIPDGTLVDEVNDGAFREGIMKSFESELLNNLFSVRINQLKKYFSGRQNYYYLSGLLIGAELKYISKEKKRKIVLCSSGSLQQLYQSALEYAGLKDQTIVVPPAILDNAAAAGQLKIFSIMAAKIT